MSLTKKIKKHIKEHNLISRGDTIVIGVSGGPDSVYLAHFLNSIRHELGLNLYIAHYNHALRKGSFRDQKFVQQLAKKLNIPCSVGTWKNAKSRKKGSVEELARKQRFGFLIRLTRKVKADSIALAHTEDDLAETVLMRILRGSGLQGIRGILPKRNIQSVNFIRPLLRVRKKEILLSLKKNKLSFCIDPTNKQTKFFRNKIRLNLIPLLEKNYNRNIKETLSNLSDTISADYDYIELKARDFLQNAIKKGSAKSIQIKIQALAKQHPSLRRMMIRLCIEKIKGDTNQLTLAHIKEIEDLIQNRPKCSVVHLPKELCVKKSGQILSFYLGS